MTDRLELPVRPAPGEPPGLPVIGAMAPLLAAAVLFAVLRSPAVLLFAALSPVIAVAGVLDARLAGRRRRRREDARHRAALAELERLLELERTAGETVLHARHPRAGALAAEPEGWRARPPAGSLVLGTADAECPPLVGGRAASAAERRLVQAGRLLRAVPLTLPAGTTVAVSGPAPLAKAFARAVGVASARATGRLATARIVADPGEATADVVVRLDGAGQARVVAASGAAASAAGRRFTPDFVTGASFARVAHLLAGARQAPLAALLAAPASPAGLAAAFAVDDAGEPLPVDLATDGPHAMVAGTTGSGKSALLAAWVLALAAAHPPATLNLLLIDCKGGAAFDPLAALPHVVGVVTDLDVQQTRRAVEGLRAELRRRERLLREQGVSDVAAGDLPRLVIVVDEFRALLDAGSELGPVFVDLASRGRSLGVHLVLCTQRPAGSIRDDVRANCGLRICLRVNDVEDSRAVLGTDGAASIPRDATGTALVAEGGERPIRMRVAQLDESAVAEAVARLSAGGAPAPHRPWLDPLPARLQHAALPAAPDGVLALGLLDRPHEQDQPPLLWAVRQRPRLLVAGETGSGRSSALTLAAGLLSGEECSADPASAWDRISDMAVPLVLDDLEHLLDRFGAVHAQAALDRLAQRLRLPGAAPTVVALRGPSAWAGAPVRPLLGLFDETLLLRLPLDDHLALGGARAARPVRRSPGAGSWRGEPAQVALASWSVRRPARAAAGPVPAEPMLLLSSRAGQREAQLAECGWAIVPPGAALPASGAAVSCGTPDAWQAAWASFARQAATVAVLVDRVQQADLRGLLGRADPLPFVSEADDVVLVRAERAPERVRLPRLSGR